MWKLNKKSSSAQRLAYGAATERLLPEIVDDKARALTSYQFTVNLLNKVQWINENRIQKLLKESGVANPHPNINALLLAMQTHGFIYPSKHGYSLSKEMRAFIQEQKDNLNNGQSNQVAGVPTATEKPDAGVVKPADGPVASGEVVG